MPPKRKSTNQQVARRSQQRRGQGRNEDKKKFPTLQKGHLSHITKGDIRRMARRGGVKRIGGDVYELSRLYMKMYISNILRDSMIYANFQNKQTIDIIHVQEAAKRQGQTALGFNNNLR